MPCQAHRSDGQPCGAWAVTGCRTCRAHGSGTRAAIEAGKIRAEIAIAELKMARKIARGLRALDERQRAGFSAY